MRYGLFKSEVERLPRASLPEPADPEVKVDVLLVDDEPDTLFALRAVLEGLGQNLILARSGREALRYLLSHECALIVLDVMMPGMDGYEVAALVRQREATRDTPIIFLTAAPPEESQIFRGYAAGAVDYIFKPIVPEILQSKVRVFVDLRKKSELVKRQVERIRRAEEEFRAVAETAGDGIITTNQSGNIIYMNGAAESLFGLSRTESFGRPLTLFMPERFHRPHLEGLRRFLTTGGSRLIGKTTELVGKRKDGSEFPLEISLSTWKVAEERFFTAILRDVSERKRAEEERHRLAAQLLQADKMASIGQLSAGIAHEINNPLGWVSSNLFTLNDYLKQIQGTWRAMAEAASAGSLEREFARVDRETNLPFLFEDGLEAIEECQEGMKRVREIVNHLRAFSHVDEGEMKPTDINALLEEAVRLCWNELKAKADVRRVYGPLPPILCYPQRIHQVFVNLLVNAAQAIEKRGEIDVSTVEEGGEAVIRIRDTGCGIGTENRKRIFDPFFTTKPPGKGTGLGLDVVYKILSAHGGRIEVESEIGKGSEFLIRLPVRSPGR